MKVFLDTNVLVSAFASRGICADVFELILLEHDLIIGHHVLRELNKALRNKVKLPAVRAAEIIDFVVSQASTAVEGTQPVDANVDPDDAVVLGEACTGEAEMFVTGDAALLKLKSHAHLKIVSPRQFWEALHKVPR